MPGYLDQYGVGEEERNRIVIRSAVAIIVAVCVAALAWYLFKNQHQQNVVKTFLKAVRSGNYQGAYRDWGCDVSKSCSAYSFKTFMSDWGPNAANGGAPDPSVLGLSDAESCNNGVLLTVAVNHTRTEALWVDKGNDAISYAPYPICPHKSPFSIMIHRTVGVLRKPFLK